ncbi:MAG TPA: gamma-glutamyl-gamma-aminobutyrate hydrolase family protein [Casimicrobiaceae bacterium]
MKLIHVAQHTSAEYLGLIEDHLEGRGIRFRYYRPFAERGGLPMPVTVKDGLILLGGGPWGAAGTRDLPTLEREVQLARHCLERGVPVVGIGLGAQILAIAAGGGADSAPLECAITRASRSDEAALGGYVPETYPLALYMRDRARLPEAARVLARDASGRPALWQIGANCLGFAGHPGLKVAMVEDLVMEFDEAPPGVEASLVQLRAIQRQLEDALVPIMTGVIAVTGWMD